MNLFGWWVRSVPTLFFFFCALRLFWIVRPNCNQGPTVQFRFVQMAHKKVLVQAFAKKYAFSVWVRWFVYLFLYFVVVILFFFFLLNTAAWALPCRKAQYGSVCKSESGGHKTEKQGRTTRRNFAHDGSQRASFGDRGGFFFFNPPPASSLFSFFLHGEQVARLNPNIAADTTTQGRL